MSKPPMLLAILLLGVAAAGLYYIKYEVRRMKTELADIKGMIEEEKESIRVLSAEWAYLSRPERLEQLSARYLELGPITAAQMMEVERIPFPAAQEGEGKNQETKPLAKRFIASSYRRGGR